MNQLPRAALTLGALTALLASLVGACALRSPSPGVAGPVATPASSPSPVAATTAHRQDDSPPPPAPFAIASGADYGIWFGEFRVNQIGRIAPLGEVTRFLVKDGGFAERMTRGPDQAIWFTDPSSNRIGRIDQSGAVTYALVRQPASGPAGITLGPDGNLWFTEHQSDRIGRATPLGGMTEFQLPVLAGPAEVDSTSRRMAAIGSAVSPPTAMSRNTRCRRRRAGRTVSSPVPTASSGSPNSQRVKLGG